jgi:hypothetical protein
MSRTSTYDDRDRHRILDRADQVGARFASIEHGVCETTISRWRQELDRPVPLAIRCWGRCSLDDRAEHLRCYAALDRGARAAYLERHQLRAAEMHRWAAQVGDRIRWQPGDEIAAGHGIRLRMADDGRWDII